eukprot:5221691-Lingulodinium_polyedra.AAC.1
MYSVFLDAAYLHPQDYDPFTMVRGLCTRLHQQSVTLGWVHQPNSGWVVTRDTSRSWQVYMAVLQTAACGLHM